MSEVHDGGGLAAPPPEVFGESGVLRRMALASVVLVPDERKLEN